MNGVNTDCTGRISCAVACQQQFERCAFEYNCPIPAGGGGGGAGAPTGAGQQQNEQVAVFEQVLDTCKVTMNNVNNGNSNSILTREEFRQHIIDYTNSFCPNVSNNQGTVYHDNDELDAGYDSYSCILCQGLLDPFNTNAIDNDWDTCGCPENTFNNPPVPINLQTMTITEVNWYCTLMFGEYVLVNCHQPDKTCFDSCNTQRDTCYETTTECITSVNRDDNLQCWITCDIQGYNFCIEGCNSNAQVVNGNSGSGGSGGGSSSSSSSSSSSRDHFGPNYYSMWERIVPSMIFVGVVELFLK